MPNRLILWSIIQLAACSGDPPADPAMDAGPDPDGGSPPQVAPCEVLGLPGPPTFGLASATVRLRDINGDGKPDLVAAGASRVSVSPGNGDTTFGARIDTSLSDPQIDTVRSLEIADLDADGELDLVLTSTPFLGPNAVNILLGDGTGHFRVRADYPTDSVSTAAVADLNGDGKPDLALVGRDAATVKVRLGNGDGTFGDETAYAVGASPVAVAVADIDGDHRPDLVVVNDDAAAAVSVLPGNGDGTFQARIDQAVSRGATRLATTDLNGDGSVDAVVLFGQQVSVLLNEGAGRLGDPVDHALDAQTLGLALGVGDVTGDDKPDVVVFGGTRVSVFTVNSAGTLSPTVVTALSPGVGGVDIDLGDVTGDRALDVLLMRGETASVLVNDRQGGWVSATNASLGSQSTAVAAADFNGDGNIDLALTGASSIDIALAGTGGGFTDLVRYPVNAPLGRAVVADVNGDGRADLVVGTRTGITVLRGNRDGTFQDPVSSPLQSNGGQFGYVFAVGDLSGDGKPDVAVAAFHTLTLYVGNGEGAFAAAGDLAQMTNGSAYMALALGDLDGDGRLDVTVSYQQVCAECQVQPSGTDVLLDHGGMLQRSAHIASVATSIAISDLDGDGKLDLLTTDPGLSVRRGNGDGTLLPPDTYGGERSGILQLADITSDGKLDVVKYTRTSTSAGEIDGLSILPGHGDGTFAPAVAYPNVVGRLGAVADIDHDGRLDVITPGDTFGVLFARCVR